jgi:hypothetical protein
MEFLRGGGGRVTFLLSYFCIDQLTIFTQHQRLNSVFWPTENLVTDVPNSVFLVKYFGGMYVRLKSGTLLFLVMNGKVIKGKNL